MEITDLYKKYKVKPVSELINQFWSHDLFGPDDPNYSQEMRSSLYNELEKLEKISERILYLDLLIKEASNRISGHKYISKDLSNFLEKYPFIQQELDSLKSIQRKFKQEYLPKNTGEFIERVEELYGQIGNYEKAIQNFNEEMGRIIYADYNSYSSVRYSYRKRKKK